LRAHRFKKKKNNNNNILKRFALYSQLKKEKEKQQQYLKTFCALQPVKKITHSIITHTA